LERIALEALRERLRTREADYRRDVSSPLHDLREELHKHGFFFLQR
jgi:hypothetical protein